MKVLYVVTDDVYYFNGVKNIASSVVENALKFTVCRISVSDFISMFENEDIHGFYFLAGPDSNGLLCSLCDFSSFKLILQKSSFEEIVFLINTMIENQLYENCYVRRARKVKITGAEFEILMLFMRGHDNREIAEMKDCSTKVISALKISLRRKMHCHSDMDLMRLIPLFNLLKTNHELWLLFVNNSVAV